MDDRASDRWRSTGLIYASGLVAVLLMAFSYRHFARGDVNAGWFALAGLPCMGATIWGCLDDVHLPRWAPYPALSYLLLMFFMMIHVWNIDTGASLMWLSAIPPFATFALGARGGLVFSFIGLAMMLAGILITDHILPEPYVVRFLCTYLLISGFTFAFERKRERVAIEVENARQHIQTLEGLLRICGWCHKKMRGDAGEWVSTEQFFQDRAPVRFSHSICPDCAVRVMEDSGDYALREEA